MSDQLQAGVYAYYVRHNDDGTSSLCYVYCNGATVSAPVQCGINWIIPGIIAAPCVVWEADGRYSGDGTSKIHLFLVVSDNNLWWLTSVDGQNFIVNNNNMSNINTNLRVSALLMENEMHLYYNNSATLNQQLYHAKSSGDWGFQTTQPVLLNSLPIYLNWSCSAATQGGTPYLAFNNQTDSRVRLICLSGPDGPNAGNGTWSEKSPVGSFCQQSPNLALLGTDLFVTHEGYDDNKVYYEIIDDIIDKGGTWTQDLPIPDAWTVNGPGSCAWGDRLYCFFQSNGGNQLYVQVYVNGAWLPGATQVQGVENVWYGISAVAVHPGAP